MAINDYNQDTMTLIIIYVVTVISIGILCFAWAIKVYRQARKENIQLMKEYFEHFKHL